MAIIQKSDGSTFYVDDADLAVLVMEPTSKYQLREKLKALRADLNKYPAPTNDQLLAWVKDNHPTMLKRKSIKAEIDTAQAAIDNWPAAG